MNAVRARYTSDEVGAKGREIYERKIRPLVEPERIGDYVVIDIDTEEYEVDRDHMAAAIRLMERKRDGARFGLRIGYRTVGRIGFAPPLRSR
jgi:hypothetical protein